jgi:benzil reductase ((S)-benzoin forming)
MIKKQNLVIISGATRGLGKQLALNHANPETYLVLIGKNIKLLKQVSNECIELGSEVSFIQVNFSKNNYQNKITCVLDNIIEKYSFNNIYLFNNASIIEPINILLNTNIKEQQQLININLISSIWLSSEFLRYSQRIYPNKSTIINISSGVSMKPILGWSLYCISKAAINMLSACIAEESKNLPNKILSVAINPGALNTDMQKTIRNSDENKFPIVKNFKEMFLNEKLNNTNDVSLKIIDITHNEKFENGQFLDFNNLQ